MEKKKGKTGKIRGKEGKEVDRGEKRPREGKRCVKGYGIEAKEEKKEKIRTCGKQEKGGIQVKKTGTKINVKIKVPMW